jgi:hypothetical protein
MWELKTPMRKDEFQKSDLAVRHLNIAHGSCLPASFQARARKGGKDAKIVSLKWLYLTLLPGTFRLEIGTL